MATQKTPLGSKAFKGKLQTVGSNLALTGKAKTSQSTRTSTPVTVSKPSSLSERRLEKAERASKWLLPQERDCRSWAISEYDAHQDLARKRHQAALERISNAEY